MAIKVHHATAARAKKLGLAFTTFGGDDVTVVDSAGKDIASAATATLALAKAEVILGVTAKTPMAKALGKVLTKPRKPAKARDEDDEGNADEDNAEADEGDNAAEDDDEATDEGRSVVKKKYKTKYRPFKHRNGDELANLISDHVAERNEKNEIEEPKRIDPKRLKKFATANSVWDPKYANLNPGMQRMNIANKLRAKERRGEETIWTA